jgi:1,4-dihydroxy-2-naphthoate octaprenyltransferase
MRMQESAKRIWAFILLTRPWFLGGGVILYLLGAVTAVAQGADLNLLRLLLGQLLVTSIQLMTHYANEYYDFEVDAATSATRTPFSGGSGILVSGQLDRPVALHATYLCLGIALSTLLVCGLLAPLMFIIGTLALLGGYFYSAPPIRLEASGWGGLNTACITAVLVPLTGCVMQTNQVNNGLLLICTSFIPIYLAMLLTFEITDYAADQAFGKRTLTVRIGVRRAVWLHTVLLLITLIGLLFAAATVSCLWIAVPLIVWQIAGLIWRSRSGWRRMTLLSGGAVALSGLVPLLWLISAMINLAA